MIPIKLTSPQYILVGWSEMFPLCTQVSFEPLPLGPKLPTSRSAVHISSHTFRKGPYVLPKFPVIRRALAVQAAALRNNWRDPSSSCCGPSPTAADHWNLGKDTALCQKHRTASHRAASQGRVRTGRVGLQLSISNPVLTVC